MEDKSIDTVITDPPYGLKFMSSYWDHGVPGIAFWQEMLRIAKPGATLMAFGGGRTYHRLTCAIEDAGWQIRDSMMWLYGSGMPKSFNISKAFDKAAGAKGEVIGKGKAGAAFHYGNPGEGGFGKTAHKDGGTASKEWDVTAPATDEAKLWDGWGTGLKPAFEPIVVAMRPLEGTFVENAKKYGVAGLWVDGGRVSLQENEDLEFLNNRSGGKRGFQKSNVYGDGEPLPAGCDMSKGRWPANVVLDEESASLLNEQTGVLTSGMMKSGQQRKKSKGGGGYHGNMPDEATSAGTYGDSGGASRFFYCAKASPKERGKDNNHPTVKPLELMRYLCRLTKTPTGGIVLDPFAGSGTTILAAILEGRRAIGIEISEEYCEIARNRLKTNS